MSVARIRDQAMMFYSFAGMSVGSARRYISRWTAKEGYSGRLNDPLWDAERHAALRADYVRRRRNLSSPLDTKAAANEFIAVMTQKYGGAS